MAHGVPDWRLRQSCLARQPLDSHRLGKFGKTVAGHGCADGVAVQHERGPEGCQCESVRDHDGVRGPAAPRRALGEQSGIVFGFGKQIEQ